MKKIRPVYNFFLLLPMFPAITLYPFVIFRHRKGQVPRETLKHEMIHVKQVRKIGWLKFYFTYLKYFAENLWHFKSWTLAYMEIPYEVEARNAQVRPLTLGEKKELRLL